MLIYVELKGTRLGIVHRWLTKREQSSQCDSVRCTYHLVASETMTFEIGIVWILRCRHVHHHS
jgi:hypothetical protein